MLYKFIGIIVDIFADTGIFHNIWVEFIEKYAF